MTELQDDVFKGLGVEISFDDNQNFLRIKETLQRIGVSSKKDNILYQSCHILHKRGRYSIFHFKEMFMLDNIEKKLSKESTFTENDRIRRNTITKLLVDWGLCKLIIDLPAEEIGTVEGIKILSFAEKKNWTLVPKYKIGRK